MIVGIGEMLWDVYPDGRKVAGGAPFNFAFHCHQLGHEAAIVSRIGDDDLGRELRHEVRRLGIRDGLEVDPQHPTGTVRVTLDDMKVPTYAIGDDVAWDYLGDLDCSKSYDGEGFWHDAQAVCFGSLALRKSESRNTILGIVESVVWALRVCDVNIRPPYLPSRATMAACFKAADWIKISADDRRLLPHLNEWEKELAAEKKLAEEEMTVIETKGADGCSIRDENGRLIEWSPAAPAQVVDTVGAGDAFTAAMVCLHLEGRPLQDCARFANHYAARVCEHHGATPRIDRSEVERAAFGSP